MFFSASTAVPATCLATAKTTNGNGHDRDRTIGLGSDPKETVRQNRGDKKRKCFMIKLTEKQKTEAKELLGDHQTICDMLADVDRHKFTLYLMSDSDSYD